MWCTQSKHNFTGSEFAWDVGYLLDPGFECACRNREMLLWPNTHRCSTDADCVTAAWLVLIGPCPWNQYLGTGKHPRGCHWRRRSLFTLPPCKERLFSAHTVFFTLPSAVIHSVVLVSWVLSWDWDRLSKLKRTTFLTQDRGRIWI